MVNDFCRWSMISPSMALYGPLIVTHWVSWMKCWWLMIYDLWSMIVVLWMDQRSWCLQIIQHLCHCSATSSHHSRPVSAKLHRLSESKCIMTELRPRVGQRQQVTIWNKLLRRHDSGGIPLGFRISISGCLLAQAKGNHHQNPTATTSWTSSIPATFPRPWWWQPLCNCQHWHAQSTDCQAVHHPGIGCPQIPSTPRRMATPTMGNGAKEPYCWQVHW